MKNYIDGDDLRRARMILADVLDNLRAVEKELSGERAYTRYLNEKLNNAGTDIRCLKSMTENE